MDKLREAGIKLRSYRVGDHKVTCPQCSHARTNKTDPCLSVKVGIDSGLWNCHHCGFKGGYGEDKPVRNIIRPQNPIRKNPDDNIYEYFQQRGISQKTVDDFGIFKSEYSFGQGKEGCIAFPYYKEGELVNVKYRTRDKKFRQEKDSERTLYNMDRAYEAFKESKTIIFVEGEMDVLSFYEAGFSNVVSLPDGATKTPKYDDNDKRFQALRSCSWLNDAEKVILAVDNDEAGEGLKLELIHRFGKDRTWLVPHQHGYKDANELLVGIGVKALELWVELADPHPIDGLYSVTDYQKEVLQIYKEETKKTFSTGFLKLDSLYTVMPSTFTVVTGVPNHGKSNFLDHVIVNMAKKHNWKFAIFSPEHSTAMHIRRLAEKVVGQPFDRGVTERMSEDTLKQTLKFLNDHFFFIESDDTVPDIDWILHKVKAACLRHGVQGVVIDPYNEISSSRENNKREDEHIRDLISKCKKFTRSHELAMWMVAHPAKMQRNQDGIIPPPTLYDISGAAHWNNMCDVGLVVHRDFETHQTRVITRKVREQGLYGSIGEVYFDYNLSTHLYE